MNAIIGLVAPRPKDVATAKQRDYLGKVANPAFALLGIHQRHAFGFSRSKRQARDIATTIPARDVVTIGDQTVTVKKATDKGLAPVGACRAGLPQSPGSAIVAAGTAS